jgi:hypothetical protein
MNGLHELTFFADRDLGRQFVELVRQGGVQIERHDDHFQPSTPDEDWLSVVAQRGWIAVTRDGRIRYSPLALSVLMEVDARAPCACRQVDHR